MSTATAAIAIALVAIGWAIARIARAGDDLPALVALDRTPERDEEPRPGTGPRRIKEEL